MKNTKPFSSLRIRKLKRTPPPGSVPGTFTIPDDALKPKINIYSYSKESYHEKNISHFSELKSHFESFPNLVHWVDIKGIGDRQLLEDLSGYFRIHKLVLADIVSGYQRPKLEEYPDHLFLVSRSVCKHAEGHLLNDQVSIFLGSGYVITIQEKYEDMLNPVRERIVQGKGYIREMGADFLAYAVMDAVLDNFFPLLNQTGSYMDELETHLLSGAHSHSSLRKIQQIKKELITIRRVLWQERDKVNDLLRTNTVFIKEHTKVFLRDAYDHSIQLMDIVESFREVTYSLMEVYLSGVNNRMNQVMKTLTIISTIFIPLTFIVGVYGMNFMIENPETGEKMPWNMPELYSPYGYAGVMIFMLLITVVQIWIFYKKGWLSKG